MSIPRSESFDFPLLVLGKGVGCWDRLIESDWNNQGAIIKWPSEPNFVADEFSSLDITPAPLGIIFSQPPTSPDWDYVQTCLQKFPPKIAKIQVFDIHPKFEIALSIKTNIFQSSPNVWTWELNSSWVGSSQSRNRRFYVATANTLFRGNSGPSIVPISMNHFQLPVVISDFLLTPTEESVMEGKLAL